MKLKEQFIQCLAEDITSDVISEGVMNYVFDYNNYDTSDISDYVNDRFSELGIVFDEDDVFSVSSCSDIDDVIASNMGSSMDDDEPYESIKRGKYSMESMSFIIPDLFERSKRLIALKASETTFRSTRSVS